MLGGDALRVAQELGYLGQRPGALVMQRAASTPERVRREVRNATEPTGTRDRHAQACVGEPREGRRGFVAVLAWRDRLEECRKEIVGQLQIAVALVLLGPRADADREAFLVEIADARRRGRSRVLR